MHDSHDSVWIVKYVTNMASSGRKLFVGPRFRRIRRQLGLSQTQMADGLGISPSYVNLIERNQRPVSAQILLRLAEAYDLDLRDLAAGDDDRAFAELNEVFSDPLFRQIELPKQELRDLAELVPRRRRTRCSGFIPPMSRRAAARRMAASRILPAATSRPATRPTRSSACAT